MTPLNASPAKAGAQFHCLSLERTTRANLGCRSWAPAFAGEASGIGRGRR